MFSRFYFVNHILGTSRDSKSEADLHFLKGLGIYRYIQSQSLLMLIRKILTRFPRNRKGFKVSCSSIPGFSRFFLSSGIGGLFLFLDSPFPNGYTTTVTVPNGQKLVVTVIKGRVPMWWRLRNARESREPMFPGFPSFLSSNPQIDVFGLFPYPSFLLNFPEDYGD